MGNLPQVSIDTDRSDSLCFGCVQNNPIGLKLGFKRDGKTARAEFTPDKLYQGWNGIVHGGIITCMLDEAMSHAVHLEGIECLTAKMTVQFKRPAPVEESLIITGSITRNTRRLVETEAKVSLPDGTVVAESTATQFIIEANSGDASNKKAETQNNA